MNAARASVRAYLDALRHTSHLWEPLGLCDGDDPDSALIQTCVCGAVRLAPAVTEDD